MAEHAHTCAFQKVHELWRQGDLGGFLDLCHEDITWVVHMDGISVPYGASSFGKSDLHWRLVQLGTTFEMHAFEIKSLTHGPQSCSSRVYCHYVHRTVREPLQITTNFRGWEEAGKLIRVEESVDAPYIEAYERLTRSLVRGG